MVTMRLGAALSLYLSLAIAASPALAQSPWDDPINFGRLTATACFNSAGIPDTADRIAMIEQLFGLSPTGATDANDPAMENDAGILLGWEPANAASVFCMVTAPPGLYDADGLMAIADVLKGPNDASLQDMGDGMFGPVERTLPDGRTLAYVLIDDAMDGLLVTGVIAE